MGELVHNCQVSIAYAGLHMSGWMRLGGKVFFNVQSSGSLLLQHWTRTHPHRQALFRNLQIGKGVSSLIGTCAPLPRAYLCKHTHTLSIWCTSTYSLLSKLRMA
ncbi:unnamed protein product [Cyberlindnera jadinii]|uniref:Uncharacterized protein n=1 Tax=Cyberlindnera jadinii (strain ATCC 18201 / CBS 1600 / BCRC 20928 / JCM 3617 / NBRC 0987 / NRRL Y-1542) TaxID=983966 RepID=A0A0H5C3J8_CYBJN|nr:unnamed protein product [Cyberlindnera jadinii]